MENKGLVAQWQQCIFLSFFKLVFKTYQKKKYHSGTGIKIGIVPKLDWKCFSLDIFGLIHGSLGHDGVNWTGEVGKKNQSSPKEPPQIQPAVQRQDETPASLDMKSSIPTRNAENIIKTARKALIREPIRTTASKINKIKNKMNSFKPHYKLEQKREEEVNAHLKHIWRRVWKFVWTKENKSDIGPKPLEWYAARAREESRTSESRTAPSPPVRARSSD